MMDARFDVAVIGGGLAGCSAAIWLAGQGFNVALFEAKTYPHHKVCGEFLSPECAHFLAELGIMPALCEHQPIHMVRISAPDGSLWETPLPAAGLSISRYVLDAALAAHACQVGVNVYEGATVTRVDGSLDDGFTLDVRLATGQTRIGAKTVIAAYGKRSSLDRSLNRAFLRQRQPFIGLKAHFYGPPLPGRIELHGFDGGYCGLSEVEGGKVNVCLLVRQQVFQKAGGDAPDNTAAFIAWMQRQNPHLDDWLSQAEQIHDRWLSISQVPFVNKQAVEQDVLMAGDSAGLIAPLAGNGMGMALQAGKLAAVEVAKFLSGHSQAADLRQRYAAGWDRAFKSRLQMGRLLQMFMLRPPLLSLGLRLVHAVPTLGHYFLTHTRDLTLIDD